MNQKRGAKKTTTKEGKREYMRPYMQEYRRQERELIRAAKQQFGWTPPVKRTKRRKTK